MTRTRDPRTKHGNSNIRTTIHKPNNPAIPLTAPLRLTHRPRIRNPHRLAKRQIRAITARLVPALDRSSDGIEDDCKVQRAWQFEAVGDFFADGGAVGVVEVLELFEKGGRLGEEGAFDEDGFLLGEGVGGGERVYVGEELGARDVYEGVADSGWNLV